MNVKLLEVSGINRAVTCALFTVGKKKLKRDTNGWVRDIALAEHSPIREISFWFECHDIPNFVVNHIVRHNAGFNPYVRSNRGDITGINDEDINRLTPTSIMFTVNLQALINISRKRLCRKSHQKTIEFWQKVVSAVEEECPHLVGLCMRECDYRGFCPEMNKCKEI